MKKKLLIFTICSAVCLGFFEFYLFYLRVNELPFGAYFSSILQTLVPGGSDKLIRINLATKDLTLYESGQLIKSAKIAAAGHPRATPTPTGNFSISLKDIDHISGLSGLVMPFSLRFYNSYYMHGLPYTRSGRIVDTPYSNGCIRLPAGLDQEIFNWADIGTKVQVYNSRLVKTADDPTVYYLADDGTKEGIPTPEVFVSRGFKWKDIAVVPQGELDVYPSVFLTKP
jgi:hypothetical protein